MKRNSAITLLTLILMLVLGFALVACNGGEEETHTHNISYVEEKQASCTESGMTAYYAVNYDGNTI